MKVSIIGTGQRGQKFIEPVLANQQLRLTALCDPCQTQVDKLAKQYKVKAFYTVNDLLENDKPDFAIVAVPHHQYLPIITTLAQHGVHIIKEKPFATSVAEMHAIDEVLKRYPIHMMIATQRRFDLIYQAFPTLLQQIGKYYHIEGRYSMNITRLDEGWRANKNLSGGGALLDMGYHSLDLMMWYFGIPSNIYLHQTQGYREQQQYDVEDTALLTFDYQQKFSAQNEKTIGNLFITRSGHKQQEKLIVHGTTGTVVLKRSSIVQLNKAGESVFRLERGVDVITDPMKTMVNHFADYLQRKFSHLISDYKEHFAHVDLIEAAYASTAKAPITVNPTAGISQLNTPSPASDYTWPPITDRTRQAVIKQLDTAISIYDRSGIVKEFEEKFANYHQRQYALLTNSGTSALFGMFEGIGVGPGDEVIVPAYTFFATASPLMYLGAKPIFCDCLPDGNIDPQEIAKKITPRTKAVVITHMWGLPCDMDAIVAMCKQHQLKLLEDCSHAHGALYKGRRVGTFGDAAVWSLQGQKILTGGEGGILLTDDYHIHSRATLQGQYNKRCKQTLAPNDPLSKFSLTGFGLKLRVHPLAVAIANEQFDHLETWLAQKRLFAQTIIEGLQDIPFLIAPPIKDKEPAWYALVFQYRADIAGCPIETFIQALQAEGLGCIERPESTKPIYDLALFRQPSQALPRLYKQDFNDNASYPNALRFYQQAIKLPVWALPSDKPIVEKYIQGIRKVALHMLECINTTTTPQARL